eukprot:14898248-Alexandrium_andersonii.AAC.1
MCIRDSSRKSPSRPSASTRRSAATPRSPDPRPRRARSRAAGGASASEKNLTPYQEFAEEVTRRRPAVKGEDDSPAPAGRERRSEGAPEDGPHH